MTGRHGVISGLTSLGLQLTMGNKTTCAYLCEKCVDKSAFFGDRAGFTLVELIAVLVILAVLAALAVPRYVDLDDNARLRAIDAGISELNGREGLAWSNIKLTPTGWEDDVTLFGT
jgi:prepilin-type N-terminal cleavage/methylation domain-containing protein